MEAVRPGIAMSAVAAVTLGSAIAIAPPLVGKNPIPVPTTASSQEVLLAGFIADIYNQIQPVVAAAVDSATAVIGTIPVVGPPIADQIDILYTYGQQAVGGTVYWVDDLVTPLATGQFWPLSGQPGTYLTGAINSTVNWGQGLINTAIGFVQAEIDYFTGWIPNLPNVITNIVNQVVNTIQQVINWITGWIPGPFAAVPARSAAAAGVAPVRAAAARAAAAATTAAGTTETAAPTLSQTRRPSRSAAAARSTAKHVGRAAAAHAAARTAR
ncbi:MAG TPA: hypothetical protein PLH92_05075 [Mycobacterium sp.]|nr:hypothetical protein [Mycobacterium sp.]HQC76076.1 hypothetical protein [Mycobacterium sp.]